jgi:Tol biopolymer transport system component
MKNIFAFTLLLFASTITAQTVRLYAPELFSENLSGAVCGFSTDGNTIYFVREQSGTQKIWMYEAKKSLGKWGNEQVLPFSGIHSDLGGRFNADKTVFYFTSDRPDGSDKADDHWNIWKVNKTVSGWDEPVPLKSINSKGMECCPVPLSNGNLLFSGTRGKDQWQLLISDGKDEVMAGDATITTAWQWPSYESEGEFLLFNSMKRGDTKGMDDIYIATWENGKWGAAKNIGEPINTKVYEDGAILSPDGNLLIFCRHDTGETPSRVMCVEWGK